jgi:hypothetical protein
MLIGIGLGALANSWLLHPAAADEKTKSAGAQATGSMS